MRGLTAQNAEMADRYINTDLSNKLFMSKEKEQFHKGQHYFLFIFLFSTVNTCQGARPGWSCLTWRLEIYSVGGTMDQGRNNYYSVITYNYFLVTTTATGSGQDCSISMVLGLLLAMSAANVG